MHKFEIKELIERLRLEILKHSYIYYELNDNIISDDEWSKLALQLVRLQNKHPDISKEAYRYEMFKDFDGSTGYNLTYDDSIKTLGNYYRSNKGKDTYYYTNTVKPKLEVIDSLILNINNKYVNDYKTLVLSRHYYNVTYYLKLTDTVTNESKHIGDVFLTEDALIGFLKGLTINI